eukprot:gene8542-17619_t
MLRPFCDRSRILDRQNGIAMAVRSGNMDFVSDVCKLMRKVHDIPRLLLRIKKVAATPVEWMRLYHSLEAGLPIVDLLEAFLSQTRDESDQSYVRELLGQCTTQVARQVFEALRRSIDFNASQDSGVLTLLSGYDDVLDSLRDRFDGLESLLTDAAHVILEEIPLLSRVSVEYVPQVGYLVAVEGSEQHLLPPQDFTFVYAQEDVGYFKNSVVYELDDGVGDVRADIADRQRVLALDLEDLVLEAEAHLQQLAAVLSTLDAILALGAIAKEMDFVRP